MSRTPEFVCMGCIPIAHNQRTNTYVRWAQDAGLFTGDCCPNVTLTECALDDPETPFVDPITDFACWYDPDYPESAEFLGLWVKDLNGMEDDPYTRPTSETGTDGTVFQRANRPGRTLTFTVQLFAATCCGMEWGYRWLSRVLRGQGCVHGKGNVSTCGTTELRVRECCPEEGHTDDGIRMFPAAATIEGLRRVDGERRDQCCCTYREYTFVVTTTTSESYSEIVAACEAQSPDPDNSMCFDWDSCKVCNTIDGCTCDSNCGDFVCASAFQSPSLRSQCYCDPYERIRSCCCLPENFTNSVGSAIIIDIEAGSDATNPAFSRNGVRNVEIVVFENPKNLPCPSTEAEYNALACAEPLCASIKIGYVPAGSHLRIDGRTGEAYLVCNGKRQPLYDAVEGNLKNLVTGCYPMVVCALWDAWNVVTEPAGPGQVPSTMTVSLARRFD